MTNNILLCDKEFDNIEIYLYYVMYIFEYRLIEISKELQLRACYVNFKTKIFRCPLLLFLKLNF